MVNDTVIAMYGVRWIVDLLGLSICEVYKCLIITAFCTPETNKKIQKRKTTVRQLNVGVPRDLCHDGLCHLKITKTTWIFGLHISLVT